jgi:hypothetical protein
MKIYIYYASSFHSMTTKQTKNENDYLLTIKNALKNGSIRNFEFSVGMLHLSR